jgi:dTDP-4-amino-4,6-dideoxygalactose transaminase
VALAPDGLPVTEAVSGQILSLPVHPHLTEEDLHRVIAAVESFPGSLSP